MQRSYILKWSEYIESVSKEGTFLKGLTLEYKEGETEFPELIRTSVLLLEKMLKHQGIYNVFVFPEINETAFLFAIAKLIFNIESGKITGIYDPYSFAEGQKLKLGNSIVRFEKIVLGKELQGVYRHFGDDEPFILVTTKDHVLNYMKMDSAPYFQLVDDTRSLSTDKAFSKAKKSIGFNENGDIGIVDKLQRLKTHYDGTIFFVTSVDRARKNAENYNLNGKAIKEIFNIATVNYSGKIVSIVPGKLKGIPALTLTYSIDNILEAIDKGLKVQSVIIDLASLNIESQADALDDLMQKNIPIVCLTDTLNSFDNTILKDRKFNYWRWNHNSLTAGLTGTRVIDANRKAFNCYFKNIIYLIAESEQSADINRAFRLVASHRGEIEELPPKCDKIFQILMRLSYRCLRSIEVLSENYTNSVIEHLEKCEETLNSEGRFLPIGLYTDFIEAINIYKEVFNARVFPKIRLLEKYLVANRPYSINMVVGRDSDKQNVLEQWGYKLSKYGYSPFIDVLYPEEYIRENPSSSFITILSGWFSKKTVRNILYSYNSDLYVVLLYENENKWKNYHIKEWNRELNDDCNRRAIEKSFEPSDKERHRKIKIETVDLDALNSELRHTQDEQESIDLVLQQNLYNRYVANGNKGSRTEEIVSAYPVTYNGGYFSFNTESHKSVVVTEILEGRSENIKNTDVKELKIGDWVVVRESSKDIIRDVADSILKESRMYDQRALSAKWKQALLMQNVFYDKETIIEMLQQAGCTKDKQTIRNWMTNDNMIIPRSRKDLEIIAKVTGDKDLATKIDTIIKAAKTVNRAHIKAGKNLSILLKSKIVEILAEENNFDTFGTLDPIEFQIDGIGLVKLLRIIDIGTPITVSNMNTNRLFAEESEATAWL